VKLNTAAILREGARIQRAEEEEVKKLASLEAGGRDDSEFLRWQEDMKQVGLFQQVTFNIKFQFRGK